MPVDDHPKLGIPAVEVIHTVLHAGGKFGGGGYKVSGGLHGVGASVVNALSTHMEVEIRRNGKVYKQEYEKGKTVTPLTEIGNSRKTVQRVHSGRTERSSMRQNSILILLKEDFVRWPFSTKE